MIYTGNIGLCILGMDALWGFVDQIITGGACFAKMVWTIHGCFMDVRWLTSSWYTVYLEIATNNMRGEIYVCFLNKLELSKKKSSIGSSQVEWDMNHDVFFSTGNAVLYSSRKSQIKPLWHVKFDSGLTSNTDILVYVMCSKFWMNPDQFQMGFNG